MMKRVRLWATRTLVASVLAAATITVQSGTASAVDNQGTDPCQAHVAALTNVDQQISVHNAKFRALGQQVAVHNSQPRLFTPRQAAQAAAYDARAQLLNGQVAALNAWGQQLNSTKLQAIRNLQTCLQQVQAEAQRQAQIRAQAEAQRQPQAQAEAQRQPQGANVPDFRGAIRGMPLGFSSADEFTAFSSRLRRGLSEAGYDDVTPIFQGSSVTGLSYRTGVPFNAGRTSDFDIALASPTLLKRAAAAGIELRSGGTRTRPLRPADLRRLGLSDLASNLSSSASRPVNFMIYGTPDAALERAPGIVVP